VAITLLRELTADHYSIPNVQERRPIDKIWRRVANKFDEEITPELRQQILNTLLQNNALYQSGQFFCVTDAGIAKVNRYDAERPQTNWTALTLLASLATLLVGVLTFCHLLKRD